MILMNINRDYLIILDVKSGEVDSPNIYYFNTDKNTSNLYVQMVIKETNIEATPIDNATNYSIKANILKPNMVGKIVEGDLVNEEKAIYEFALPADCTDFSGNAKIEFEVYTGNKIATSFATKFKVHGSVLTEQNKYIEDSSDYPILKELMAEVKVINETAHELDTAIRTLQSDMIEANNEMRTNEATRQANEATRVDNEATRISQENARQEYLNAFDGKWQEYKDNTDADIANYKEQINAQEAVRNTQEQQRQANEQRRISNEDERKVAENQRKANEFERRTNEVERKSAEASRVSTENARATNEEQRQTNEANREAAEEIRKANEEARITAERARVTEHDQMRTELNEVKTENAVLMENDKKIADRMTQVEISDKRQYVIMEGLMNSAGDGYLKIEDTGNDTTLYNSVEGFVDVKNITGNTMVNSIKNPDDELTLNADINTSGQSVTLTTAVDNGQVDVLAEGNTMVNVCDQQEAVAITTDTNTFPLRYLYTSTEYTLQFESDTAVTIDITLGGYTLSSQNIVIGLNKINIITPNELTDNNLILNGTGFNASNIVVTEATDKDFGYFSGMKSVGELEENKIEILSSNKNLFECEIDFPITINGTTNTDKYLGIAKVKPNTYYSLSADRSSNIGGIIAHEVPYDMRNEIIDNKGYLAQSKIYTYLSDNGYKNFEHALLGQTNNMISFITKQDTHYLLICCDKRNILDGYTLTVNGIQLQEGSLTSIVPHSSNKKQILLNEPLRAVGDSKDRFTQIDGKWYVERNCFYLLADGSSDEKWSLGGASNAMQYGTTFRLKGIPNTIKTNGAYIATNIKCDKLKNLSPRNAYGRNNDNTEVADGTIGIATGTEPGDGIDVRIPKSVCQQDLTAFKTWLSNNPLSITYQLNSPTYEPVEISPVLNTYTDVTHITNNSTIPMNMPIVNSGYEIIAKPNTKYTVVGMTNGRIGNSTIVNGTITTPATITDNFLRPYGTGKTSKVMLLEGEPANIPGYFKGIKSVFEDKVTEDGKYVCEVRVYNDLGNETVQTLYLDEPLYNTNNITIYNDKLGYWKNYDIRDYQDGDFGTYLTDMTKTVYQLAEPVFVPLIDNCPNWVIGSWDNCSIHFDSIIPLKDTRYRYTGNVPSVISLNEEVSTVSDISDQQDALLVDMATELAVMKLTM